MEEGNAAPAPRPLAQLDARTAGRYDRAVAAIVPRVERLLGPEVLAERAHVADRPGGPEGPIRSLPWGHARGEWNRWLTAGLSDPATRAVVKFDVRACYASIRPAAVERALREAGIDPVEGRAIAGALEAVEDAGVEGLAVGPAASAVLANLVLRELDEGLGRLGLVFRRWVDDVVVLTPSATSAEAARSTLLRGLDRLGLEPSEPKTATATDPVSARAILRLHAPSRRMTGPVG